MRLRKRITSGGAKGALAQNRIFSQRAGGATEGLTKEQKNNGNRCIGLFLLGKRTLRKGSRGRGLGGVNGIRTNKTVYAVLFVIVPFALDHLNIFSCDSVYQSVHIINTPTPQAG